jgi:polyphosphate kinase 2 (PPK2 family)
MTDRYFRPSTQENPGSDEYDKREKKLQLKLLNLQTQKLRVSDQSVLILFEGWDAAGKGGAIKRLVSRLDPRFAHVHAFAAPNEVEKSFPYLWRFWQRIPAYRELNVFDRSWYGRVLVERVEKFASPADWRAAYDEITAFEQTLINNNVILMKFFLWITKEEQLERFQEREKDPFKRYKMSPEDWRNRKRWKDYQAAASEMFRRTSTRSAPWSIIDGNDKKRARLEILERVAAKLEASL